MSAPSWPAPASPVWRSRFAAQSILKDWISGFFLLTEGQIRINDVIKIGELSGSVEMLTMRTTVLRAYDGTAHVFSNGAFQNFSNLTMGHSYCVFDVAVEFDDDPERLMALLPRSVGSCAPSRNGAPS